MKPDDVAPSPGSANPGPSQRSPGPDPDPAAFFRQLGEQTSKVLTAAEEAAQEIREQARRDAAVVLADARMQSDELARAAAAERRVAEEELRRFREARAILANQIEDVRRRLEEIILRLRTPVDAPDSAGSKPEAAADQAASAGQDTGGETRRAPALEPHEASRPGAASRPAPAPAPAAAKAGSPPAATPEPAAAKAGGSSAADRRDSREVHRVEDVERREGAKAPAPADAPRPGGRVAGEVAARARAEGLTGQEPAAPVPDAVQERLDTTPAAVPLPAPAATGGNRAVAPNGTAAIGVPAFAPPADVADEPPWDSPQAEAFRRRAEALGDIPLAAARSLKRLLQEDQNDLLDRIRRSRGRGSFEQDILPAEVQLDRFGHGLRTVLDPAFLKGRTLGGAPNIGESPDPIGSLVAKQVVAPLRRDLARMIEPRLAAGDTVATVSERAGDVYRVWKGVRTELLGEGLAFAAFHHGLLEAWREGHVGRKRWVMSPDEADCPKDICRTNEAAGLVGLDASFPSGHLAPPAHGACSCTVIAPAR